VLGIVASRNGRSRNGRVRNGRFRIGRSRIGTSTARGGKSKGNAPCIVVHCNLCLCIHGMLETIE
jgi:hypothetical protein